MTQVRQYLAVLAMVVLAAGACAHGTPPMQGADGQDDDKTVISITNNNWSDMTIYLVRDGLRRRLGTVPSQTTDTFSVPTYFIMASGQVQLMADPIGSRNTFTSMPIVITPGQRAEWKLENSLALSTMWVR